MKKTKMLTLLLILTMVLSLMGCASNEDKNTSGENQKQGEEKVSPDADNSDEGTTDEGVSEDIVTKAEYPAVDLGGRVIKIGAFYDLFYDSKFLTLDDVDAAGLPYANADIMQKQLDNMREVESKWNVKFEWVNLGWDGIQQSINTSITAGAPECDIYIVDLQFALPPVLAGYAERLGEIAPENADVLGDQIVFETYDVFGINDALFHEVAGYPTGGMYMGYNADMLESLGLERPELLAERGEWTWEKFAEYAKKCTQDTDLDGNPDIYGFGSAWNNTLDAFKASNNGYIAATLDQGLDSKEVVETFEFIRRLYIEDKSARPIQTDWEDNLYGWSTGKVVFGIVQPWQIEGQAGKYDFELRICPTPIGPSGDGSLTGPLAMNNYMISKGIADPTSVYCVFEELLNWYDYDTEWRDDPSYLEACFGDVDQFNMAIELANKAIGDNWNNIDREVWATATIFNSIVNGEQTVAQAIEAYKQLLQDQLDGYKK